jgi:hypothetical protein
VPLLLPGLVGVERLAGGPVVALKYYRPVASRPTADALYERVACFPCHEGVAGVPDQELSAALAALAR